MPQYKQRDLSLQDQVGLAAVAVLGRSIAKIAYMMAYPSTKSNQASLGVQISRWLNDQKSKDFIQQVKSGMAQAFVADSSNIDDLTTRDGIIGSLITSVKASTGKEAISGLQTLAKLQGYDKPDETNEEEKRVFVLPWLSHCRSCKLMKVYLEVQKEKELP